MKRSIRITILGLFAALIAIGAVGAVSVGGEKTAAPKISYKQGAVDANCYLRLSNVDM